MFSICRGAIIIVKISEGVEPKTSLGYFVREEKTLINGIQVSSFVIVISSLTWTYSK